MNQYYAIYGNEAKVIDENDNKTPREVTENFNTILIKENEKEEMEYKLEEANNTIKEAKPKLKKLKKLMLLFPFGGAIFGLFINLILSIVSWDLSFLLSFGSFGTSLLFSLFGGYLSWATHFKFDMYKDNLNIAELQSYFLEKEIPKKEQELERLKKNSQKIEISNKQLDIVKVDDRETLIKLREYFEKLRIYGSKIEKVADKYATGFWTEEDKEKVQNDGINSDLFESYLIEYNTRKLMKGKKTS